MNFRSIYRKFTSILLLAALVWNVGGWLGIGLATIHNHHTDGGQHCEVTLCYCEVKGDQKICMCHHPELHAAKDQSGTSDHVNMHHAQNSEMSFCFYTPPHQDAGQELIVVIWDKLNTIINNSSLLQINPDVSPDWIDPNIDLLSGYSWDLIRPPMV